MSGFPALLRRSAGRRRDPVASALIGVLTLLLGFALAVQVRSTDTSTQLTSDREEDLVRVLDDLTAREARLRQQLAEQRGVLSTLDAAGDQSSTALSEARQRAETLGIVEGTVAATGPGLTVTISDPDERMTAAIVVRTIEELRGAGAETMQVDGVRIGVGSAVTGDPGGLEIDAEAVRAPYEIDVIGAPEDLEPALDIPGGVAETVRSRGGELDVVRSDDVVVDVVRARTTPRYAEPTHD